MNRAERQHTRYLKHRTRHLRNRKVRESYEEDYELLRFVAELVALRQKRNLSQTQLAARIRSSQAVISRLEQGRNVELQTLQKVARALNARLRITLVSSREGRKPA